MNRTRRGSKMEVCVCVCIWFVCLEESENTILLTATDAAGRWVSPKFGYGLIDAGAAVAKARDYNRYLNVTITRHTPPTLFVNQPIMETKVIAHFLSSFWSKALMMMTILLLFFALQPLVTKILVNFTGKCEHIQVIVSATHPQSTELTIRLTSPSGVTIPFFFLSLSLLLTLVTGTTSSLASVRGFSFVTSIVVGASRFDGVAAQFGAVAPTTKSLVIAYANGNGCTPTEVARDNPGVDFRGKLVVVVRGVCVFTDKAESLDSLGASVVLIQNNVDTDPFSMSGTSSISIPVAMISREAGDALKSRVGQTAVYSMAKGKSCVVLFG